MRFFTEDLLSVAEPTDAELRQYLLQQRDRYQQPAQIRLSHVFLSRQKRGPSLRDDAQQLLQRLRDRELSPQSVSGLSDSSTLPGQTSLLSPRELARIFGTKFARQAFSLTPGTWHGPITSSYGLHLVWVKEKRPQRAAELAEVRKQVRLSYLADRRLQASRKHLDRLRRDYEITIQKPLGARPTGPTAMLAK